jgi:hypothetical protein
MPALNHLIIPAKDKDASAKFLANVLSVEVGQQWGRSGRPAPATV